MGHRGRLLPWPPSGRSAFFFPMRRQVMEERYWEAEVREIPTSIVKIVETVMVLRDDDGHVVAESLWERRLAPLS